LTRFKVDENLPAEIADLLRNEGHDAVSVADQSMSGCGDPALAKACREESRALVTLDLDFSDIRAYPPGEYQGIVVLRPMVQTSPSLIPLTGRMAALVGKEPLAGCLWIVDDAQVRVRGSE